MNSSMKSDVLSRTESLKSNSRYFIWNPYNPSCAAEPFEGATPTPLQLFDGASCASSAGCSDGEDNYDSPRMVRMGLRTGGAASPSMSPILCALSPRRRRAPPPLPLPPPVNFSECKELVEKLRNKKRDSQILPHIQRLESSKLIELVQYLSSMPALMLELCEKERGNVLSQLMGAVGGESCGEFVRFVMDNAMRLATNQSGCIAFTRVFDAATQPQRQEMCDFALANFYPLAVHAFGNYVVQRAVEENNAELHLRIADMICAGDIFELTSNKFGSHVVESFFLKASPEAFEVTVRSLLSKPATIRRMANDNYANYTLQTALRRVTSAGMTSLHSHCVAVVKPAVANTNHMHNIVKALS